MLTSAMTSDDRSPTPHEWLTLAGLGTGFVGAFLAFLHSQHTASGFTETGVRLGLGHHGWLWRHCGTIGFALIAVAFALEIAAWFVRHRTHHDGKSSNQSLQPTAGRSDE